MNEVLKKILLLAIPFIKELIESKVVPALKRKTYERLDDFTNDRIEDLAHLVDKIKTEENETKRTAHLEGFRLGVKTLRTIGKKLIQACDELEVLVS